MEYSPEFRLVSVGNVSGVFTSFFTVSEQFSCDFQFTSGRYFRAFALGLVSRGRVSYMGLFFCAIGGKTMSIYGSCVQFYSRLFGIIFGTGTLRWVSFGYQFMSSWLSAIVFRGLRGTLG